MVDPVCQAMRIYTGEAGESCFGTLDIPLVERPFAPPAPPLFVSAAREAVGYVVIELPAGWGGGKPHPSPAPHHLACLSGRFAVTSSRGETRSFGPGDSLFLEDTTGKGHVTEVVSAEPVRAVMIRLS
jgi:hypothetical protein